VTLGPDDSWSIRGRVRGGGKGRGGRERLSESGESFLALGSGVKIHNSVWPTNTHRHAQVNFKGTQVLWKMEFRILGLGFRV
jgi:hypothetical protein